MSGRGGIDRSFGSRNLKPRTFDYVIVGAGSAGCTLANRLTEDSDVSVLVLEAGGWDRDMWIHLPLGWGWAPEIVLPPATGLGEAFAAAPPRLDVRERAGGGPRRTTHRMRAREGGWRVIVDQRDGLCSRQPRRLRPLGGRRPDGMVVRACAAVFPSAGALGGRRRRLSRERRSAGDGNVALPGSALRRL